MAFTRSVTAIEGANSPSRRIPRGYAAAIADAHAAAYQWQYSLFGAVGGGLAGGGLGMLARRRIRLGAAGLGAAAGIGALTGAMYGGARGWRRGYFGAWDVAGYPPAAGYA